jgi:hypothetical protein
MNGTPGIDASLRITISIGTAIIIGLISLFWNGAMFGNTSNIPPWVGNVILIPVIAMIISYASSILIQQLSCGHIQLITQAVRVAYVPIGFIVMWLILYWFPSWRWPIEGLIQGYSYNTRHGLSSAFYAFVVMLYTQALLNGLAQVCPR